LIGYRSIYTPTLIPLSIKLLRAIKGSASKEEVDEKIETLLYQNSRKTREKIKEDFMRRYLTFESDRLVQTPLLELVSRLNDMVLIRELLYYHYIQAERIGAEIIMGVLYPKLPEAEYVEDEVMRYVAEKMPGKAQRTLHNTYACLRTALKDFGLLRRKGKKWVADTYFPKLESFVYALHHECTVKQNYLNPKMSYLLGKAEFPRLFLMTTATVRDYVQRARREGLISYEVCAGDEQIALIHKSLDRVVGEMIRRS